MASKEAKTNAEERDNYDCAIKIVKAIKRHLCKEDEDYDKPIISPKFLNDCLDLMFADGFEKEALKDDSSQSKRN